MLMTTVAEEISDSIDRQIDDSIMAMADGFAVWELEDLQQLADEEWPNAWKSMFSKGRTYQFERFQLEALKLTAELLGLELPFVEAGMYVHDKLKIVSSGELVLKAAMAGLNSQKVIALLANKHVNRNGEVWHHMRGAKERIWFKNYEPAECPEVWEGDLSIAGELRLGEDASLRGLPKVVHGDFSCVGCNLSSAVGLPEKIDGKIFTAMNFFGEDGVVRSRGAEC